MDGWMDGWMDGCMDGWTDATTDEKKEQEEEDALSNYDRCVSASPCAFGQLLTRLLDL